MNSGLHSVDLQSAAPNRPEWRGRVEAWRQLLAECGRKPGRKRVHDLRVATLRLQAEVEYGLREAGSEAAAARVARRWSKQAGKLRRVLQPVRAADVYLAKLGRLRGLLAVPGRGRAGWSSGCLRQMGTLERKLAQGRRAAAKKLVGAIAERQGRLDRLSKELEAALAPRELWAGGSTAQAVGSLIAQFAAEFPELNGDNLHEFRRRIKTARYLVELSPGADPAAKRQAAALKKMQTAAGEWHDWQTLAKKAGRTFRGRHKEDGLAELLETLAEESLERAIDLCQRTMARLQKESAGDGALPQLVPQRFPARRAEPAVGLGEKDCA